MDYFLHLAYIDRNFQVSMGVMVELYSPNSFICHQIVGIEYMVMAHEFGFLPEIMSLDNRSAYLVIALKK
jgi:hypothetical protein